MNLLPRPATCCCAIEVEMNLESAHGMWQQLAPHELKLVLTPTIREVQCLKSSPSSVQLVHLMAVSVSQKVMKSMDSVVTYRGSARL